MRVVLTIMSLFRGALTFAEMSVHFAGEALVRRFYHDGSGSGDSAGGVLQDVGGGGGLYHSFRLYLAHRVNYIFNVICDMCDLRIFFQILIIFGWNSLSNHEWSPIC